jgi:hypothetical protein
VDAKDATQEAARASFFTIGTIVAAQSLRRQCQMVLQIYHPKMVLLIL